MTVRSTYLRLYPISILTFFFFSSDFCTVNGESSIFLGIEMGDKGCIFGENLV